MGAIHVHEFISLDGVIDTPSWTFKYPFTPGMMKILGGVTSRCRGILLGRKTYQMFRAGLVEADGGGGSGSAVLQRHHEIPANRTNTGWPI
jgi:hypothetical protein